MHNNDDIMGFNDEYSYRCECGQCYGRHLRGLKHICQLCGTEVIFRSSKLPKTVVITDFIDCVHKDNSFINNLVKSIYFKLNIQCIRLIELSEIVFLHYHNTFILIKYRRHFTKKDGRTDFEKTYSDIKNKRYNVINTFEDKNLISLVENTNFGYRNYVIEID